MLRYRWWEKLWRVIPTEVIFVLTRLQEHGYEAYLVGGAPRDLLLSKVPTDWDLSTNASPERIKEIFAKTILVGEKFGTVLVVIKDFTVEVTTFRREGAYTDGRHPDWVEFTTSLLVDLSRRDFTINAIAIDPLRRRIIDPFGGRRDLKRRIIRTVGEPRLRFQEDDLRMLRFFRFQSTLGFRGERRTEKGINPLEIKRISGERIGEELTKLLISSFPERGLTGMARTSLLTTIIPEFIPVLREENRLFQHLVATTQAIKPLPELRWAALLHDLGKVSSKVQVEGEIHYYGHEKVGEQLAVGILERLRYASSFGKKVSNLIRLHMFSCNPAVSDAALRRLVIRVGRENIKDLLELRRADIVGTGGAVHLALEGLSSFALRIEALLTGETVFSLKDLAINGHDVMELLSLPPGPKVGEVLQEVFRWVIEDPKRNQREMLLGYLEKNC